MTKKKYLNIFDLLVLFVIITSVVSISSLALSLFNVHAAVILSMICTLSIFWLGKNQWQLDISLNKSHTLPLMMLLLIALLFRSDPYHYVAGGQDQGVYMNMSKYFENYGKVFIEDEVRMNLPEELKEPYDSSNMTIERRKFNFVDNEHEGYYLPGVYVKNQDKSEYVFQFYHLQPLWMAISGKLLGDEKRTYALVFFSLLSLVAFYFLTFEFTKNIALSFLAGLLLAINPLHAFFSKFPVTEVVALTFTALSFYYLLRYYNHTKEGQYYSPYLIFSSLLISGMFYTRISGFMFIPFFYLILLLNQIFSTKTTLRFHISLYVLSVFLFYSSSVLYGLKFSYPYTKHIYGGSFSRVFGAEWEAGLSALVGVLIMLYVLVNYISRKKINFKVKESLAALDKYTPFLFLPVLALGMYKIFSLGFTENYIGHPTYDLRWQAVGTGWDSFLYSSIVILIEYTTPFILAVFSLALFSRIQNRAIESTLLIFFILLFFIHISLLQWFIPYQYYYARYLLSEILPFTILFTVIGLKKLPKLKKSAYLLVALSIPVSLFFTVTQFKGKEMDGLHSSLSELEKHIAPNSVLILDSRMVHSIGELKTPLVFYYGYNAISVNTPDRGNFVDHFCSAGRPVHFLSRSRNNQKGVKDIVIDVSAETFKQRLSIPTGLHSRTDRFYLSSVDCAEFKKLKFTRESIFYESGFPIGDMEGFHDDGVWTKSTSHLSGLNLQIGENRYLMLETFGWHPLKGNISKVNPKVLLNGIALEYVTYKADKYYFRLPDIDTISECGIISEPFIPRELGVNQDTRQLGLDIKSIRLIGEINL